ncbi:Shikimate O-hydroxycinnamoyltransferase [Rhynchospora pubera]|uniref:Shikimate O-hydroxycinnamoyltransferase n=1 Tax=Rhynchospora pubera TaxID=906938 RepID=A0AAV8D2M0_9POAL|nr:Shikimate O-hydroxycinnamoyltransferase [Rhynchospora pubera]
MDSLYFFPIKDRHEEKIDCLSTSLSRTQKMVEITQSTIVTPSEETPKHKIWLSNLDVVAARGYTPTIYVYPSTGRKDFFPVDALKAALAKALVVFYPLAGRLNRDPETGRPEIDCTGEGVIFFTASLDATLYDFKDFAPSEEMRKKLVPVADSADPPCAMMMLQMTRLRCGGIILGFAIHHYTFDGRGASLFIKTFSAFARGDVETVPAPFFDRTLLRARSPPSISFDHSDYTLNVFQSEAPSSTLSQVVCANLKLTKEQIHSLKILAGGERVSTFRAVVAHVWKCSCIARGLASDAETQLLLPVDLRGRFKPPLPPTYIGNPTMRTKAVAKVEELVSNTLEFGANLIQRAVDNITDEFGRSLIDHLESMDLEALCKRGAMSNTSLMAISWLSVPMYDADFGWGEPILMARAQMYGSGYVYLSRVPAMDGGISVIVGLEPDSMQCFKKILYEEIEEKIL